MDQDEITRSAKQLIDQFGLDASIQAVRNAEVMLEQGDIDEFGKWLRIGRTVEVIQAIGGWGKDLTINKR